MKSTTSELQPSLRPSGEFIQERRYLFNVSPKTIIFYGCAFKAFEGALEFEAAKRRIVDLRNRGVKAVSVNTYLTCLNAYWRWCGLDWKLKPLKEEQKILATLSDLQIGSLVKFSPGKSSNLRRAHLVALTILDTGLRASEVLGLTKEAVDFDNLVIKVVGKGGKHRVIPFSQELRKLLYRYAHNPNVKREVKRIFGTKNDTAISVRNLERDFHVLGQKCGITGVRFSPHTLRHTFAVMYLRAGGNLEFLRRILGHSSILTTQRYLRSLGVEDLGAVHSTFSPLGRNGR